MRGDGRFVRSAEQEQTRKERLKRAARGLSNYKEEQDVEQAGPRCGVCELLQPHECLDGRQVVRS